MDRLIQEANVELDDKKREELLQRVGALFTSERVVIPIAAVGSAWAMRRDRVTLRVAAPTRRPMPGM